MSPFETAIAAIDAANADDPNSVVIDGIARPAEIVYAERMSQMLDRLHPEASDALRLAVRAQHLRRWAVPRDSYPLDRMGYHRWRNDLKRKHADWAGEILVRCGIGEATVARTQSLIRKENLKSDAEAQTLEDVACLVFLLHYAEAFLVKHDGEHDKLAGIASKTWAKMSENGREMALRLALPHGVRSLVDEVLAAAVKGPAP